MMDKRIQVKQLFRSWDHHSIVTVKSMAANIKIKLYSRKYIVKNIA